MATVAGERKRNTDMPPESIELGPGARAPEQIIGRYPLRIEDILALASGTARARLNPDAAYRDWLRETNQVLQQRLREGRPVYGVTTGVGGSVQNQVSEQLQEDLPHNIVRLHGCGTGRILDEDESAAVVAVRLVSLARGYSGVRAILLERLCDLLNHRLLPRIPAEGSVGASGDLTPLSYVAATLIGEREVTVRGTLMSAAEALCDAGLAPLFLRPKESLAVMNGTAMMTGLGCLAFDRATRLARLAAAVTAIAVDVTHGNPGHFDKRIFDLKPHPGQSRAAAWIRSDLAGIQDRPAARLQDRYSLRCAPHVIGVLLDALAFGRQTLEIEINGVSDNPIIDPESGDILHGGNFYGGHIAFVLDGLKTAVASVADLLDRQLTLLCCPETSDGLPENLVAEQGAARVVHHGFKAMQISSSALTAEALKLTMPATSFSRSTESHNQDKVSMGSIAARDCLRILELSETVAAISVLAGCQAIDLRGQGNGTSRGAALHEAVRATVPMLRADRRQDHDIERVLELHRSHALPAGTLGPT